MNKLINETYVLYDTNNNNDCYLYVLLAIIFGTPFVVSFAYMAFGMGFHPFFAFLFICALIFYAFWIRLAFVGPKKEHEKNFDIKTNGKKTRAEIIHIHKSSEEISAVAKIVDNKGHITYQIVHRLPSVFWKIKLLKKSPKELIDNTKEELIEFDIQDNHLVLLSQKTNTSHTMPVVYNFSGTIYCTIYEKDDNQLVDDFECLDVEM